MKNFTFSDIDLTVSDLYERVARTAFRERERVRFYDDSGFPVEPRFDAFEVFEFVIFIEIKNAAGEVVLQVPAALGFEINLEEALREQLLLASRLLPGCAVTALAVENSLVRMEEWDLFGQVSAITGRLARALEAPAQTWARGEQTAGGETAATTEETAAWYIKMYMKSPGDGQLLPLVISNRPGQQWQ